jgi:hypothetical protein
MKKILFLCTILSIVSYASAQDFNKIANMKLETLEDYKKAEPDVLKLANFVFKTPSKPETMNRMLAFQFILLWMEGTDAYTFRLGEDTLAVTDQNEDLLGMYLAGITKVALENGDTKLSDAEMHEKTTQLLAEYCSKKENKLKPSKALKKVIKKMKKG